MSNRGGVLVVNESSSVQSILAAVDKEFRLKALQDAIKAASQIVIKDAKSRCPKGQQRTGKKSGKKHLRDTITRVFRDYGDKKMDVVGPAYPAGAHGHLVEYGHEEVLFGKRTGRRVPPKPFMRPAVDATKQAQHSAIVRVLTDRASAAESQAK